MFGCFNSNSTYTNIDKLSDLKKAPQNEAFKKKVGPPGLEPGTN
jgi:hypothetical protein